MKVVIGQPFTLDPVNEMRENVLELIENLGDFVDGNLSPPVF